MYTNASRSLPPFTYSATSLHLRAPIYTDPSYTKTPHAITSFYLSLSIFTHLDTSKESINIYEKCAAMQGMTATPTPATTPPTAAN